MAKNVAIINYGFFDIGICQNKAYLLVNGCTSYERRIKNNFAFDNDVRLLSRHIQLGFFIDVY